MRVLDGFALDLAPHQPGVARRRSLAGVYWIMLLLAAMQALCTAVGSAASVAAPAAVQPLVSAVHPVSAGTAIRDWFHVQSVASGLRNPDDDHRTSSTSMQVADDLDPDDDGFASASALASPYWLVILPADALATRPEPRRLLGRTEAPPHRPPTSAA